MSKVDDELTRRLHRAERPVDTDALFEGLERRRSHRERARRVQAALLAFAVLAATVGGFSILTRLFDPDRVGMVATTPFGATGAVVVCGDSNGEHLCRIDGQALARGATSEDLVRLTDTQDEIVSMPAVSFDGTTVVFDRYDPHFDTTGLWVIGTDGSDERLLAGGGITNASWSPTGLLVAVAGNGSQGGDPAALAILDPRGGPDHRVATIPLPGLVFPSTPRFSPDGGKILFVAGTDPNSTALDIYAIDADGSHLRNLTDSPRSEWTPAWSPDGQRIVFGFATGSGEELFICSVECSNPLRLEDPSEDPIYGGLPVWSPDGEWIAFQALEADQDAAIHLAKLDGTEVQVLASPASQLAWISAVDDGSKLSPEPEPSSSSPPEAGRDIGLGFNLCDLHRLGGIDWFGDGRRGAAWTGRRLSDGSRCPTSDDTSSTDDSTLVIADLDADGLADTWSPLDLCIGCEPWAKIDLDANGAEELVVLIQGGTTPQYGFYHAVPEGLPRASSIYSVGIGGPGAPNAGFPIDKPVTIWAGGDEGDSFAIRCEGYPTDPILVAASLHAPVDTNIRQIHVTRLKLETTKNLEEAHFVVLDSTSPPDANEPWGGDGKACGVDFNPWA
jgi:WD40 repeat protein